MDLGGMADKAKDYAAKNPDAGKRAVDGAEGVADNYVGADKARMAGDRADQYIDSLGQREGGAPDGEPAPPAEGDAPPPPPAEGEAPPA